MEAGSVTFSTALDNKLLEKELASLEKKILRQTEKVGRIKFKKNDLEEQLKAAREALEKLNKIKDPTDFDMASLNDLHRRIPKIEAEIKKCAEALHDANRELDYSRQRYGEIDQELADIRQKSRAAAPLRQAEGLQELSDKAREVNERLHELAEEYADLASKSDDFNPDGDAFLALRQEIKDCVLYLDELAENGQLAELASGAEIAEDRIDDLIDTIEEYEYRLENFDLSEDQRGILSAKVEKGKRLLDEYQDALDQIAAREKENRQINPSGKDEAQSRLTACLEKTSGLYQKLAGVTSKTKELSGVLQDLASTTTGRLSDAFQTAGQAVGGFSAELSGAAAAAGPYLAIALAVVAVLKRVASAMWEFGKEATQSLVSGTKAAANFVVSSAQAFVEMLKSIGKFGKTAIKTISSLTKKTLDFGKRANVFARIADTLSGKFKRLGSTIKSALVFSVIYKGLSLLREQMGAYLNVNTQFMTALRRLQGVLLTAFQPIYEVVVPALTTLINVLARAAATVTQFFTSLFGTTAKQAQTNAKDLYEQANATTAAGDAAEEASKQLAGFDEINKLEGSKSAGGGGSTSVDTGPLFDYEYDETPFDSWGEAFSAFLDKLLGGIPKLREAFQNFADWLNGWSKKLYDMFTFPGVLDKVKQLGHDLADALNELVNRINWYQLGQALGAGLNLALNFLTSFLYEFDWMNLGSRLAEFINGLVSEIDWYEFGRLLWAGFKIGLETLAGFLLGLDMPQLAEAASNIVIGFFDEMKNTINRIPWKEIGAQIARFLNNIQWYEIITSAAAAISAAINALFATVRGFIDELHWDDIAEQIYTAINDSLGQIKWREIGETIGAAFKRAFDFMRTVVAGINWHQIGENIAELILGFDWAGALGGLADLIAEGINAAIRVLRGFLDKIMPEIKGIAEGIAERLKNAVKEVHWDELGQVIGDAIKTALTFVAGLLDPGLFYEIGKAIGDFLINLDWPGILEGLGRAIANGIKAAVALVRGFLDTVKPNLKELASDIARKINEFVASVDWAELGRTINEGINAALDFLLDILDQLDWDSIGDAIADFFINLDWGGLMEKWGTIVGRAMGDAIRAIDLGDMLWLGIQMIDGLGQGMMNKWDESGGVVGWLTRLIFKPFIDAFKSLFGIHSPSTVMAEQGGFLIAGLLQGISDTWNSITDFFSEKVEALKKTLLDAWANIKKDASEKWAEIKKTLGDKWEEVKTSAKEKFEGVRQKVSEAWNNIKSDAPGKWEEIKTTLAAAWDKVRTTAEEKFKSIKEKIIEKMDEVKDKDWFQTGKTVVDGILSGLESIWNSLTSWAKNVKDTISDALSGASSARSGSFGSTRSGSFGGSSRIAVQSMPDIGNFEIPALAKGAVIPPNREFLAVLGDQRIGNNLEGPEDTFRQIVRDENAAMIGVLREILSAIRAGKEMTVDGDTFAKLVYSKYNSESSRKGVRLVEART